METSEEVFVSAEGDDLFGTEALRGTRCSCSSHKASLAITWNWGSIRFVVVLFLVVAQRSKKSNH